MTPADVERLSKLSDKANVAADVVRGLADELIVFSKAFRELSAATTELLGALDAEKAARDKLHAEVLKRREAMRRFPPLATLGDTGDDSDWIQCQGCGATWRTSGHPDNGCVWRV